MASLKSYLIGAALLLALAFGLVKQCSVIQELKKEKESVVKAYQNTRTQLLITENKHGHQVAQKQQIQTDFKTFRNMMGSDFDSLVNLANAQKRKIRELTAINAELSVTDRTIDLEPITITDFQRPDSTYTHSFVYKEPFFSITGRIIHSMRLKIDSLNMRLPLNVVVVERRQRLRLFGQRRKWLPKWGPKVHDCQVTSPNPYFKTLEIESFQITR